MFGLIFLLDNAIFAGRLRQNLTRSSIFVLIVAKKRSVCLHPGQVLKISQSSSWKPVQINLKNRWKTVLMRITHNNKSFKWKEPYNGKRSIYKSKSRLASSKMRKSKSSKSTPKEFVKWPNKRPGVAKMASGRVLHSAAWAFKFFTQPTTSAALKLVNFAMAVIILRRRQFGSGSENELSCCGWGVVGFFVATAVGS